MGAHLSWGPVNHEKTEWDRRSRSSILRKLWQFACSRQMLFGESQKKILSADIDHFVLEQLDEATFKSSSRFWLEALISPALECLEKHWTIKSEKGFFYYYCVCLFMYAVVSS